MALIFRGASCCPICSGTIGHDDDIVATSHFIADGTDPLWRFSDAAMHKECFLHWELREAFVARYNAYVGSITWGNGTYHEMQPNGRILCKQREATG